YATADYTWSTGDCNRYGKDVDAFADTETIAKSDTAMWFTRNSIPDAKDRNYACLDRNAIYNADGTANSLTILQGYTALKKFESPGWYTGDLGNSYTYADQLVFRLSDTYLLAAEACYRLGGTELTNAATYINVVRNRACEGHDGSMDIASGDVNVDFILAERARELCGEYTRWIDLKRMGKEVMSKYIDSNPDIKAVGKFNIDTHYVWPIPDGAEINYVTNPDEYQNPGY
ncbi:MAG: RagB/SusD family nutrient uptake outer membrane protein, partial [Rikenellaceae bacterium]|nr:RagB/SusD family nutrient uptake outer membrane protein [Rikenellaceae bacterium]